MRWKPPLLSRIALSATRFVPERIYFAIWIAALDELQDPKKDWVQEVEIHDPDGSIEYSSVVRWIRLDKLRRRIWREKLHATLEK